MFRHAIPIGRIFGISIDLDYSWFLVFGLLTWALAVSYYPGEFKHSVLPNIGSWVQTRR